MLVQKKLVIKSNWDKNINLAPQSTRAMPESEPDVCATGQGQRTCPPTNCASCQTC